MCFGKGQEKLRYILDNPKIIEDYGKKAFDCVKRNHDKEDIDKRFISYMTRGL